MRSVLWLIIGALIMLAAVQTFGRSPEPRPAMPDVGPTLAELDRAHRLVWEHPLAYATWRAAR